MTSKPWLPLKKGDIIDLVAPGSACTRAELNASIKTLRAMGFEPRVPDNFFSGHKLFSHDDQKRFSVLKKALTVKDSRAIWCVRGGYGSVRLLPYLEKLKRPYESKALIGYSDITTIHHFLNNKWGWPTLHGPLFDRLGSDLLATTQIRRIEKILTGDIQDVSFTQLKPMNKRALKLKSLSSTIVGGNLCVLNSTLGTPWQFSAKGKILFLEDIGERPHRVDRMLVQLEQSGVLSGCRGMLLGDFLIDKADRSLLWNDVFARFVDSIKTPVFKGLPVGHGKIQRTLPLGTHASLKKLGSKYILKVNTGAQ